MDIYNQHKLCFPLFWKISFDVSLECIMFFDVVIFPPTFPVNFRENTELVARLQVASGYRVLYAFDLVSGTLTKL